MRRQFFIKLSNQGQFQNPQEKQILKLSLVVRFDKELMEIFTVKEKASVFEVSTFFGRHVYVHGSGKVFLPSKMASKHE